MQLSNRELWTVLHGMVFGAIFLLSFAGGLAGLWSLRPGLITAAGLRERLLRMRIGLITMAFAAWATVLSGNYVVYPWYRATPPQGTTDLTRYPRSFLRADPDLATWHTFGMEWKEHVAWLAPILATAVAFVVSYYGPRLVADKRLRNIVLALYVTAFAAAAVAGMFGAFLNKVAPVR
ncbi:MAG: hypothetical protein HY682_02115 [Chloroflexi bacterium]|nr:hypothetical protein [Chloroflexota bacterium]